MSKDAYFFLHDYDTTGDPKIQTLLGEYGAAGYGIFWRIVEMLHSETNHKLPLKSYIFMAITKQMLSNAELIKEIVNYCIDPCEIFESDNAFFWSNRVNSNLEKREKISEIRSKTGKCGASSKWGEIAIANSKIANDSKGKERKGKKKEEKKLPDESALPENNFIEEVIAKFLKAFPDYKVTVPGKERKAAGTLIKIWKQNNDFTTEELLNSLESHFKVCRNIKDTWYRNNMSLFLMVSKYNEIEKLLKGCRQGVFNPETGDMVYSYGN
jgi:hypothetical protein